MQAVSALSLRGTPTGDRVFALVGAGAAVIGKG
jgi:hypothetical protein